MRYLLNLLFLFVSFGSLLSQEQNYFELRIYHCHTNLQIEQVGDYLQNAFIPLAHANGFSKIGVFEDAGNDTTDQKKIIVFIPSSSLSHLEGIGDLITSTNQLSNPQAKAYLMAKHDQPVYDRVEISWLRGFTKMPQVETPNLDGPAKAHIFELRSYEAATEILYRNKVDMFNYGGEIELFESLEFNAVFYAETLTGQNTPNLWYMTSFDDIDSREAHWKSFGPDPRWQKMKAIPKYQNTVSHADVYLLKATAYSDIK